MMDETYDEWLMALYLQHGEREFSRNVVEEDNINYLWEAEETVNGITHIDSWFGDYPIDTPACKLTPKALDYLKSKAYNGSSISTYKE